jgi:hypothetical protein
LIKDDPISLDEVVEKAKTTQGKHYESIVNFQHQLKINKLLMDLKDPNIPDDSKTVVHSVLENPSKAFEPKAFQKYYDEDDLGGSIKNVQNWLYSHFHNLSKYK